MNKRRSLYRWLCSAITYFIKWMIGECVWPSCERLTRLKVKHSLWNTWIEPILRQIRSFVTWDSLDGWKCQHGRKIRIWSEDAWNQSQIALSPNPTLLFEIGFYIKQLNEFLGPWYMLRLLPILLNLFGWKRFLDCINPSYSFGKN